MLPVMPRTVRISLYLQVSSFAVIPLLFLLPSGSPKSGGGGNEVTSAVALTMLLAIIAVFALWLFIAIRAYCGRNWARWTLTVLYVGSTLLSLPLRLGQRPYPPDKTKASERARDHDATETHDKGKNKGRGRDDDDFSM